MRARFVLGLDAVGIDAGIVAAAFASGHLTLGYAEFGVDACRVLIKRSPNWVTRSIPYIVLERMYVAFGLPRPQRTSAYGKMGASSRSCRCSSVPE